MSQTPTMPSTSISDSVTLYEIGPNKFVSMAALKEWLPTIELALWFAKLMKFDYHKLSDLLYRLFNTDVMRALMAGDHSTQLQSYIVDTVPTDVLKQAKPEYVPTPDEGEVLAALMKDAVVEVAKSIQEVADKLTETIGRLPGKQGRMMFQSLAAMNSRRPTIGDYRAVIRHDPVPDSLVIFDVSGSVRASTVRAIVNDVVGMSWNTNSHLAIVSDSCFYWEPGTYSVDDVLAKAQYGGTRYETLAPLFKRDWDSVVCIADYDSSSSAKRVLANCKGRINTVFDISLVAQPTYLSECVAQLAQNLRPLLISRNLIRGW